ncbi:chemotaxis protein [Yinghuangia seranimata]|uniref:baeRF3 domain-containing protein n=1 Tax=Yinghuangia seranimata TaxID=408067 RepID=UPI00248CEDC7|nr:chemotaxis protein [Yinghuangia seranimata]MDI2124659.1 chemotaxis protein [Yinghuangia seranimata]
METQDLTAAVLRELRAERPYPAVSVTMPTHRREPDNAQDPIRLRNLLAEAGHRIDGVAELSSAQRTSLKEQLERAAAEVDLRYALDGLVLFATADRFQSWTLPRTVPERVVLASSFLTRNLVAAREQTRPYWVMAVDSEHSTLWSGSDGRLSEHTGRGFPAEREELEFNPQREERIGDEPSTFADEETRRYLRDVDSALADVLKAAPRPLYLVGLAQALSLLDDVGTAAHGAAATITKGGLADGPGPALVEALRPALADVEAGRQERAAKLLDGARSRKSYAGGLDDVWTAVREGRAETVVVEATYQRTVRMTEGHLEPFTGDLGPDAWENGVREDIVDEIVETALDTHAEVLFVPDDAIADSGRIAAALRY